MFYTCLNKNLSTSDEFNTNCSCNAASDDISALSECQRTVLGIASVEAAGEGSDRSLRNTSVS